MIKIAGTYTQTLTKRFGNCKAYLYNCTNFTTADEITVHGINQIFIVIPTCATANTIIGYTLSANTITIAASGTSDDGYMLVIGK